MEFTIWIVIYFTRKIIYEREFAWSAESLRLESSECKDCVKTKPFVQLRVSKGKVVNLFPYSSLLYLL